MTDVLREVGLSTSGVFRTSLASWIRLISDTQPDIVLAEYAPGLLQAAKGRVKTVSVGTGFTCPPTWTDNFPPFAGDAYLQRDDTVTDIVNRELVAVGLTRIDALPRVFESDCELLATFPEIDPYANLRRSPAYISPALSNTLPQSPGGMKKGIFVYSYNFVPPESGFWLALAAQGFPTIVHMHDPSGAHVQRLTDLGLHLTSVPLGFDEIVRCCSLVVSHGGHGLACSCILTGLPSVVASFDVEKELNGRALSRLGVGAQLSMARLPALTLAHTIATTAADTAMKKRASQLAGKFNDYVHERYADQVSRVMETL